MKYERAQLPTMTAPVAGHRRSTQNLAIRVCRTIGCDPNDDDGRRDDDGCVRDDDDHPNKRLLN